jgi:hypothetical protein
MYWEMIVKEMEGMLLMGADFMLGSLHCCSRASSCCI